MEMFNAAKFEVENESRELKLSNDYLNIPISTKWHYYNRPDAKSLELSNFAKINLKMREKLHRYLKKLADFYNLKNFRTINDSDIALALMLKHGNEPEIQSSCPLPREDIDCKRYEKYR